MSINFESSTNFYSTQAFEMDFNIKSLGSNKTSRFWYDIISGIFTRPFVAVTLRTGLYFGFSRNLSLRHRHLCMLFIRPTRSTIYVFLTLVSHLPKWPSIRMVPYFLKFFCGPISYFDAWTQNYFYFSCRRRGGGGGMGYYYDFAAKNKMHLEKRKKKIFWA